ncbi:MAG: hypothetical protein WCB19_02645 [Thermoplasmata archaeon]
MPITRDEFDLGKTPDSWEDSIQGFLNSHPSEAFGVLELAKAIQYPISPIVGAHSLHAILHRMAAQGKIQERIVRTGRRADTFYATMG